MKKIPELLRHYLAYFLPQKVEDIGEYLMAATLFGIIFVLAPIMEKNDKSVEKYTGEMIEIRAEAIIHHYIGEGQQELEIIEEKTHQKYFDGAGGIGERLFRLVRHLNNGVITAPDLIIHYMPSKFYYKGMYYYGSIKKITKNGKVIYEAEPYPKSYVITDIFLDLFMYSVIIFYYLFCFALLAQIHYLRKEEGYTAVLSAVLIYFGSLIAFGSFVAFLDK